MPATCIPRFAASNLQCCRRQELRSHAALLQRAKQIIKTDAVASTDDKIGELKLCAEQLHVDASSSFDNLFVTADCGEAVGAAERGDASGSLPHRISRKRYASGCFIHGLHQTHE